MTSPATPPEPAALAGGLAKPRLRGTSHAWAFAASIPLGILLLVLAPDGEARTAVAIYAVALAGLFGVSALYHRVNWRTARARRLLRRLDHAMIFVLIAGTNTPFAVLALEGTIGDVVLLTVWAGALVAIVVQMVWIDAPKPVHAAPAIALGWVSLISLPSLVAALGAVGTGLVVAGGVLYTLGAVTYARRRPDPKPLVFGYHEVFHAFVIAAALLHYAAVAFVVLPDA